jgi:carboxymethylenebutenolidase
MTELQRYLAEEVAEDHADGIITRREAMRRLGLLGVAGATATSLLAAFEAEAATAPRGGHGHRGSGSDHDGRRIDWAPMATEAITFPGRNGTLMGAWAPAATEKAHGAVLVIHENRGLTDHIRQVAGRFAADGWSALALDLLSEEGGTGAFPGEAEVTAALNNVPPERFDQDMQDALTELRRRVERGGLAAIGFCFGGGMIWRLLATGDKRLDAAAPFYGPFTSGTSLEGSKAAVLGVYGGLDTRVLSTSDAAFAAIAAAGLDSKMLVFSEADHAFFNDTGARFNPPAAAEAWRRTLAWFERFAD